MTKTDMTAFQQALAVGRPPNVKTLFPNSRALIVSGKAVDRSLTPKQRKAAAWLAAPPPRRAARAALAAKQRRHLQRGCGSCTRHTCGCCYLQQCTQLTNHQKQHHSRRQQCAWRSHNVEEQHTPPQCEDALNAGHVST